MNKEHCKKYCALYGTCKRTKCERVPLFLYGSKIIMVEPEEAAPHDLYMKKMLYHEARNTKLN